MNELENLLRETLREHEKLVAGAPDLLPEVRRRIGRRRRRIQGAAALGAVVAATVVAVAGGAIIGPGPAVRHATSGSAAPTTVPEGWRLESSLGAEFVVPGGWVVRDGGCESDRGTVVRAGGFGALVAQCVGLAVPAAHRSVARVDLITQQFSGMLREVGVVLPPGHATTIGGVAAERGEGRVVDGRFTGWVQVPSRGFQLTEQTPDTAVGRRILDSLRLVDVDFNGCPTPRSALRLSNPGTVGTRPFVPPDATAISVCYYGERQGEVPPAGAITEPRLRASARLTGEAVRTIAAAVNTDGPLPKPPARCAMEEPQRPDAVLLIRDRQGHLTTVFTTSNDCTGLGLDNGRRRKVIPRALAKQIMHPLHTQYGPDPELAG